MTHALTHWIGVVAVVFVTAGSAMFMVPHELEGDRQAGPFHALDPVEVVVDMHGTAEPTGIYALAVVAVQPGSIVLDAPTVLTQLALAEQDRIAKDTDLSATAARLSAWTAALESTGVVAPHGLLVTGRAAAPLRDGDVILGAKENAIARLALPATHPAVTIRVLRDGRAMSVDLRSDYRLGPGIALVDVGAAEGAPAVTSLQGFEGASDGLAMALGYLQVISDGDLTDGRPVAATGVLTPGSDLGSWNVTAVGSAGLKAVAAARAGLDTVLVPTANAGEVRRALTAAGLRMTVVPVGTLDAAVRWLCSRGGTVDLAELT